MKNEETINLTVADLRRAHDSVSCSTAKQVIKALKPEAFEDEIKFDKNKIYAVNAAGGSIFVLRDIGHSLYGWSSLYGTGAHCSVMETPEKAIELENFDKGRVKVFSTQKDFINWCYEQTR